MKIISIAVLGDSLALPRPGVSEIQTFPRVLETTLAQKGIRAEIIMDAVRYRTSIEGRERVPYICRKKPDFLLIDLGLVDCAPRFISRKTRLFLDGIKNKCIAKIAKKSVGALGRLLRRPKIVFGSANQYVSYEEYRRNMEYIIKRVKKCSPNTKIVLFTIAIADAYTERLSPGISYLMNKYNGVLRRLSKKHNCLLFDAQAISQEYGEEVVFIDAGHWGVKGNEIIGKELADFVLRIL